MKTAATTGRMMLMVAAVAWLLAGFWPQGLVVCQRSNDSAVVGLSCTTAFSRQVTAQAVCCLTGNCPGDEQCDGFSPRQPCRSCMPVQVLPAANHARDLLPDRVDSLLSVLTAVDPVIPVRCDSVGDSSYQANAPPGAWSPRTIRLLI